MHRSVTSIVRVLSAVLVVTTCGFACESLVARAAHAQSVYTWNVAGSGAWTTAANWTPARNLPASTDILVIDGVTTPSPTVTSVPTETIGRLRVVRNAAATVSATSAATVTIGGATSPSLEVQFGASLTLSGANAIALSVASGATATIGGAMTLAGGAHRLLGADANSVAFANGGSLTTGAGFSGNAFGSTGTPNTTVFQGGSTYTHNAGSNPFGLTAPASKVAFETGSTVVYRTTAGFSASGRTYANLTLQNSIALASSGSGDFAFHNLAVEAGSSFTHTGSGGAAVTLSGDISAAGSGNVSFTAGTGGIQCIGGAQTFAGGGTGTITFGSSATIASNATLATARTLTLSGAGTMLTVNGVFKLFDGGWATGGSFVYGASGQLTFNASGTYNVDNTHVYWPATNGPGTVTVQSGAINMNPGASRTIPGSLRLFGGVLNAGLITVTGTLEIDNGGYCSGSPVYSGTATLVYAPLAGYNVGGEWGAGNGVGAGVPYGVTIVSGTVNMPASDRLVAGDLRIVNFGHLALNAASGDLKLAGNWYQDPTATFTPNNRAVFFTGSNTQTISRSGMGLTFDYLVIDKPGANLTLANSPSTNITVRATMGDALQILNAGGLDLNGQSLTLAASGGNILVGGTAAGARTITGTGVVYVSGAKTVVSNNGKTLVFDAGVTVAPNQGIDFGTGLSTIKGTLRIDAGGFVNTNPPAYATGSTLVYNSGGTYGRSAEWSATSGSGYPYNVTIAQNTTLDLGANGAAIARRCAGALVIDAGSALTMNAAGHEMSAALTVLGNVQIAGTLALSGVIGGDLAVAGDLTQTGTFTSNGRAVFFQGSAAQNVGRTGGTMTIDYIRLAKSGGSVALTSDLTCTGPNGGNALEFNGANDLLDLNGRALILAATIGGSNTAGAFKGGGTSSLVLNGSGAMGTIAFAPGTQSLANLTVNRSTNGSVTLGSSLTVTSALALTNGVIVTGTHAFTVTAGASVTRTFGWVAGALTRGVAVGAPSVAFDVGSSSVYAPVTVAFGTVTAAGELTASTTNGDHPAIGTSGITPSMSVNRFWRLANNGIAFDSYDATFTFAASDVDAGADPARFVVRKYDAPNWSAPTVGTRTATSTQAIGLTSFSDFAIGNAVANQPPVVNAIPDQTVAATTTLTVTPTGSDPDGDVLTWSGSNLPAGATVNPATGVFTWTPPGDAVGTYPGVTLTADDGHGGSASESFTITVTNSPTDVGTGAFTPPTRLTLVALGANPSRERVAFAVGAPAATCVLITVSDASGRRIATLASQKIAAGYTTVVWSGRTDRGASVPAGLYVVRADGGRESATLKILRVR
jgi:hypothetical protein